MYSEYKLDGRTVTKAAGMSGSRDLARRTVNTLSVASGQQTGVTVCVCGGRGSASVTIYKLNGRS